MNSQIFNLQNQCVAKQTIRKRLQKQRKALLVDNKCKKKHRKDLKNSMVVLEYLIQKNYGEVVELFEDTITAGLQELFNDEYAFIFELDRSGDHLNCEFQIATDNCPYYQNLRMNYGKSLQEIVACVLRIVICYLDKDMPNVVILDEPFGGNRDFRQEKAHEFLNKISQTFNMQIVIVTQNQDAIMDNIINLSEKPARIVC